MIKQKHEFDEKPRVFFKLHDVKCLVGHFTFRSLIFRKVTGILIFQSSAPPQDEL